MHLKTKDLNILIASIVKYFIEYKERERRKTVEGWRGNLQSCKAHISRTVSLRKDLLLIALPNECDKNPSDLTASFGTGWQPPSLS